VAAIGVRSPVVDQDLTLVAVTVHDVEMTRRAKSETTQLAQGRRSRRRLQSRRGDADRLAAELTSYTKTLLIAGLTSPP
jgi:hypothetical protein